MKQEVVNMPELFRKIIKEEHGTVAVLIAISFTVLMGFAALAVDFGVVAVEKTRMMRNLDAAVLAGAQELPSVTKATAVAQDYASRNGLEEDLQLDFSSDHKQITGSATKTIELYFAKAIGINTTIVDGRAAAKLAPVKSISGIMPFGFNDNLLPLTAGNEYMLKSGAHNQTLGWRGIIRFPGAHGAGDYVDYVINGYPQVIEIGDKEDEEVGNVSGPTSVAVEERIMSCNDGCTWDNYLPGCPRITVVPIYHDLAPAKKVEIVGYASVFLDHVQGNGENSEIYARYIERTVSAEADDTDTGVNGYLNTVRLSE